MHESLRSVGWLGFSVKECLNFRGLRKHYYTIYFYPITLVRLFPAFLLGSSFFFSYVLDGIWNQEHHSSHHFNCDSQRNGYAHRDAKYTG